MIGRLFTILVSLFDIKLHIFKISITHLYFRWHFWDVGELFWSTNFNFCDNFWSSNFQNIYNHPPTLLSRSTPTPGQRLFGQGFFKFLRHFFIISSTFQRLRFLFFRSIFLPSPITLITNQPQNRNQEKYQATK